MEDICEQMIGIASKKGESLNQRMVRNLKLHDEEFWSEALDVLWDDDAVVVVQQLSLKQVIECAYALCDAIVEDYELLSRRVMKVLRTRCCSPMSNYVDGMMEERLESAYGMELYLRRLYLTLRSQSFDVNNDHYIGSRQRCLCRCICFVVMFFEVYDDFDAVGMKNVDWLTCIMLDRRCRDLGEKGMDDRGRWETAILEGIGGGKKSICQCVFDLVNTKNPSGGMIGPGNCMWFHRFMLRVSGRVGEWYEKLLKNHAAIHDAFGFLVNQNDIGPGYMYGIYPNIKVESQHWWNHCCFMGQLSGLYVLGRMMTNKGKDVESFASFDTYDEKEKHIDEYSSSDGRTRTPRH